jgi:snRNA-activating protein complex (SNAPc), subunit 3
MQHVTNCCCLLQKHSRKRRCELCERAPAVKVTHDDAFAPGSPAFWCLDCFNRMHYDGKRQLVSSDFKVFDYVHD